MFLDYIIEMHIIILKGDGRVMNIDSYNCQELGLAKALVRKGFDVSIVMAGHNTENIKIDVDKRYKINVYYRKYRALHPSLAWFEKVESLLCLLRPDFIQIHGFTELMSFRVVKWANKHSVRCNLIQGMYRPTQKPFFKQLEELFNLTFGKYVIKHVDSVGAKTPMAASYIRKYYNRQVGLTLIGLDTEKLTKDVIETDWKRKLKLDNKKILLYIGVLEKRRNPLFLLEIIQRLPEDYVLLIVGDGPQKKEVNDYILNNQLGNRCIMLGKMKQNEVSALYKVADVFLLASDYEIYGMVILESMFFGLPVVTTLTAGSEAIIDNNINGVILKEKDVDLWCQEIIHLCASDEKYKKISAAAKEKVEKELIWDKAVGAFIAHYKSYV